MAGLLETVASNSVIVALGAMVLSAVCRFAPLRNSPAARQALWMLLLVKLVTPSLVSPSWLTIGWTSSAESGFATSSRASGLSDDDRRLSSGVIPLFVEADSPIETTFTDWAPVAEFDEAAAPTAIVEVQAQLPHWSSVWIDRAPPIAAACSLLVSAILLARFAPRARRVRRLLRMASDAPEDLTERLRSLARRMGIERLPRLVVVDGRFSPFLWASSGAPTIVFPKRIMGELTPEQLDFVLAHELAHWRRGDRWTNWFTAAMSALFWFHPAVWLARREIRAAQEICCDALVVELFAETPRARRSYADTLLASLDFVNADASLAVPSASTFGETLSLRRRFEMIANSRLTYRWSWPATLAVLLLAAALPAGLTFGQAPTDYAVEGFPVDPAATNADSDLKAAIELAAPSDSADVKPAESFPDAAVELKLPQPKDPVLADDVHFANEQTADAETSLIAFDTGAPYRIVMQNGPTIVGEVVKQDAKWKVIKLANSEETMTINVDHIQSFQREDLRKNSKYKTYNRVKASAKPDPDAKVNSDAVIIGVIIGPEGQTTIDGVPVEGEKMMFDALISAAKKHKGAVGLEITAHEKSSYKTVEYLMALAGKAGVKIARVSQGVPQKQAIAAADIDNDGKIDLLVAEARKAREQALYQQQLAQAQAALAEQHAQLANVKAEAEAERLSAEQAAIREKLAAMGPIFEQLKQELAAKNKELEAAQRVIQELREKLESKDPSAVKP